MKPDDEREDLDINPSHREGDAPDVQDQVEDEWIEAAHYIYTVGI